MLRHAPTIKNNLDSVAKEQLPSTKALDNTRQIEVHVLRDLLNVLVLPIGDARTLLVTTTVPASIQGLEDSWAVFTALPMGPDEKQLSAHYVKAHAVFKAGAGKMLAQSAKGTPEGDAAALVLYTNDVRPAYTEANKPITALTTIQNDQAAAIADQADASFALSLKLLGGMIAFGVLFGYGHGPLCRA